MESFDDGVWLIEWCFRRMLVEDLQLVAGEEQEGQGVLPGELLRGPILNLLLTYSFSILALRFTFFADEFEQTVSLLN
jgi:hypothetical protein